MKSEGGITNLTDRQNQDLCHAEDWFCQQEYRRKAFFNVFLRSIVKTSFFLSYTANLLQTPISEAYSVIFLNFSE